MSRLRTFLTTGGLCVALLATPTPWAQAEPAPAPAVAAGAGTDVAGAVDALRSRLHRLQAAGTGTTRLEVRLRPGADRARALAHVPASGAARRLAALHAFAVEVPAGDAARVAQELSARPDVAGVAVAQRRHLDLVPDDASWAPQSSYLSAVRFPQAWDRTRGDASLRIAVVDSGVDVRHADLVRADGTPKVVGTYNAVDGSTDVTDEIGHGTFVAGAAAAATDNGLGVSGAGFDTSLLAVKVADGNGDIWSDAVAEGVRWAADHGARVINLSLGSATFSALESEAVSYATAHGAVVVAAAGNEATSAPSYPAALPGVVAVGATSGTARASFSNYGSWVDVGAPGVALTSTTPTAGSALYAPGYDVSSGTSFASPLVAGEVALLAATRPSATVGELAAAVSAGTTGGYGFAAGRIDVPLALDAVTPHAVRVLRATPPSFSPNGDGRRDTTTLTWSTQVAGTAHLEVRSAAGQLQLGPVALGEQAVGSHTVPWSGRSTAGVVVPDGTYLARVTVTAPDGTVHTSPDLPVTVDRTPPNLVSLSGAGSTFYPVRDGYLDAAAPVLTVDEALSDLRLRVYDAAGHLLRVLDSGPRPAGRVSVAWDGRRADGTLYPAGTYAFTYSAYDVAQNVASTARYPLVLSLRHLVARVASATVTPAASAESQLVGSCSAVRTPARGTTWTGSYEYLSAWYAGCAADGTSDLAATLHRFTLPAALRYGTVQVSAYGRSLPGYLDTGVLLYRDRAGDPTGTGRVLGTAAGSYAAAATPVSALADSSRTVHWAAATTHRQWYQVKSFTVTWGYYVLS